MPGGKILFGGDQLTNHKIPAKYGSFKPTAMYAPISNFANPEYFKILTTEMFGPFFVITDFGDDEVDTVLQICEHMQ